MNTQEIIQFEQQYVVQTYKRADFVLERGQGVWLYDAEGKEYLDAGSGIAVNALGHGHKVVAQAIHEAADGLLHVSNLYHTAPHVCWRTICAKRPLPTGSFSAIPAPKPTRARSNLPVSGRGRKVIQTKLASSPLPVRFMAGRWAR